ncbi:hypothetical protein GCM10007079_15960 [Nocardiopsis terrae]|nr:hypothetical protein GCM10007079_15960 [Nocardiopsis terrae]
MLKKKAPRLMEKGGFLVLAIAVFACMAVLVEPVGGWASVGQGGMSLSLTPFGFVFGDHVTDNSLHWEEWMLNILLFVPLGIVAALTIANRWGLWLFGPVLSLAIEVGQAVLATGRQSALDDLLANSAGYFIGVAFVLLAQRILTRQHQPERATT